MIHFLGEESITLNYSSYTSPLPAFCVRKEKPHIEFYRLLNSSCNAFFGLIIHRAPWQSYTCCLHVFRKTLINFLGTKYFFGAASFCFCRHAILFLLTWSTFSCNINLFLSVPDYFLCNVKHFVWAQKCFLCNTKILFWTSFRMLCHGNIFL